MVLEKTLESPLDCKEIQPVHSKGAQPWVFFGRNDAEAETLRMRWLKYWSFSFSIIPFKEHPGLVSFRMDCLDLLAVQGTLESFPTPQFKSINSSELSFLYGPVQVLHQYNQLLLASLTEWKLLERGDVAVCSL